MRIPLSPGISLEFEGSSEFGARKFKVGDSTEFWETLSSICVWGFLGVLEFEFQWGPTEFGGTLQL